MPDTNVCQECAAEMVARDEQLARALAELDTVKAELELARQEIERLQRESKNN